MHRHVNCDFFKNWKPEMAYVLGFFAADGTMIKNKRGAYFVQFEITDRELLKKIRNSLNSNHKIAIRKRNKNYKPSYRLQIGSKVIFKDLLKIGITPRKALRMSLPKIPEKYIHHFVRGYFDGDGNVWYGTVHKERKTKTPVLLTRFTSGNKRFLENLASALKSQIRIGGAITCSSGAYQLGYSTRPSLSLYRFMYNNSHLFLPRKKKIFEKYINAVVVQPG